MTWLGQRITPAVAPVAVFEERRLGLLRRAILVTREGPGARLDRVLVELADGERRTVARELGDYIRELHRLGYRDGNLDLRNLLAHRDERGSWRFVKIDAPRFRLRAPGTRADRWTRADWNRLLPQLARFGVDGDACP